MNNPHKDKYILINQTLNSAKVIRTGADNKYYNFVNKSEVIPKQVTKYSVKILKAANSLLMIGFCTEKGLGNINNHNSVESAYYCCELRYITMADNLYLDEKAVVNREHFARCKRN